MTRYAAMFDRLAKRGEGALGTFLMLGDPSPERCVEYLDAMVAGGADMIEVGIPFSDPVADGPVIQAAAGRALAAGVRTADCFRIIADFRARHPDVPIGVLTYANIVAARGIGSFCAELAAAGADSLLIADVPSLEAGPYAAAAKESGINLVMVAAGNTPPQTLDRIARLSGGYTYCVARAGVTGERASLALDHAELFGKLANAGAPPPVLGFGISTPAHIAAAIREGAAGVIVGSALVRMIGEQVSPATISEAVAGFKNATRR